MSSPASVILALMLLQYPYPSQYPTPYPTRNIPRAPAEPPGGANTAAVATFSGEFKSADKKFITIEVDNGQSMRMYITASTKFFRDDKPAKASDFHSGENVDIDAARDARMNLLAVRVAPAKPKQQKSPEPNP